MSEVADRSDAGLSGPALSRSGLKRRSILEAARTVFLQNGYAGTSMDQIAALAAVSKQTVYKNFVDKERLFTEVITGNIAEAESRSQSLLDALPDSDDPRRDLQEFARQHIVTVMQPHLVRMRRILISEADRFPELARTWFESGPERGHATLAERFAELTDRGHLHIDDPLLAAQHFNWLVLSIPLNQAMFRAVDEDVPKAELERYADEGVRVFLAAYG
ncbi:TetR/AcrR family transcriptional regulator [Pseudonocardia sp. TRM90224]|uniref:TetR/AcrR family transcriptional regulator n=1 Tax=Pseudonocardia sp. TRM90224 TaxID=2812678 RepID=UPI001E527D75|nr:TetR/AcrR family transcriptional regulator [Pseudonocardia sp. TRM90224]